MHAAVIKNHTKEINESVTRKVSQVKQQSELTNSFREKIEGIVDYEQEFDNMFGVFKEGKLPKDELYWQIKAELDSKARGKPQKKEPSSRPMLPTVHATRAEQQQDELHKMDVAIELQKMEEESRPLDKNGNPIPEKPPVEPTLVKQIEKHKMAFKGSFDNIDE